MRDICHPWKRREMLGQSWSRNLNERARLENMGHKWKYNVRMHLTEIRWEHMDWIYFF
jgi:hypothetical protein